MLFNVTLDCNAVKALFLLGYNRALQCYKEKHSTPPLNFGDFVWSRLYFARCNTYKKETALYFQIAVTCNILHFMH